MIISNGTKPISSKLTSGGRESEVKVKAEVKTQILVGVGEASTLQVKIQILAGVGEASRLQVKIQILAVVGEASTLQVKIQSLVDAVGADCLNL